MKTIDIKAYDLMFYYIEGGFQLTNISFEVAKGECFQVMGDGNAGKSTLLKLSCGLLIPQHGAIFLFGKDINSISSSLQKEIKKKVGVVFQESTPINNISIFENVALPLRYHTKLKESEIKAKVCYLLDKFGIINICHERPHKLPSNERINLDIARALVLSPEVLFLDSPFSRLVLDDCFKLLKIIGDLKKEGVTIFVVSNDKMLLHHNIADKILVLEKGKVVTLSSPEEILNSDNIYIKSLLSGEIIKEENICDTK